MENKHEKLNVIFYVLSHFLQIIIKFMINNTITLLYILRYLLTFLHLGGNSSPGQVAALFPTK